MQNSLGITDSPSKTFTKDAFITSLREGDVSGTKSIGGYEPEGMAAVRIRHEQLQGVVEKFSEKISTLLGKQEKDFLVAYRMHMFNVEKELNEMRAKMERSQTEERRNERIRTLEEEKNWYRAESLRLDAFNRDMKKDLDNMAARIESLEEDHNWLENELKSAKRQNRLLQLKIQKSEEENKSVEEKERREEQGSNEKEEEEISHWNDPSDERLIENYERQIRELKLELLQTKKSKNRLLSKPSEEQSEIENFFRETIERMKRNHRSGLHSKMTTDIKHDILKNYTPTSDSSPVNNPLLTLNFDARVCILNDLLNDADVLAFLLDKLVLQNASITKDELPKRNNLKKENNCKSSMSSYPVTKSTDKASETLAHAFGLPSPTSSSPLPAGSGAAAVIASRSAD